MTFSPESEKTYPVLMGHSVLIIESLKTAGELFGNLHVIQGMKVTFVNQADFPEDLADYMNTSALESSIIHVPGVALRKGADIYLSNILRGYKEQPRMIILEGYPVNQETVDMYEAFRRAGIPMVDKFWSTTRGVEKLVELFT